jgi:hypothetical protein
MKLNVRFHSMTGAPVSLQGGHSRSCDRLMAAAARTGSHVLCCLSCVRHQTGKKVRIKLLLRFHAAE